MNVTRKEFTDLKLEVGSMTTKVERNENDIQAIFKVSEEIKKSVDRAKWQVFAMVAVPVLILIIKLVLPKG